LAGLEVSTAGYRELAQMIRGWSIALTGGRSVWALEGGYNLRALGESVVACLEVLLPDATDGSRRVDSEPDRG
jgi:acetoin utilization deacetylase AcuC-like enzyme